MTGTLSLQINFRRQSLTPARRHSSQREPDSFIDRRGDRTALMAVAPAESFDTVASLSVPRPGLPGGGSKVEDGISFFCQFRLSLLPRCPDFFLLRTWISRNESQPQVILDMLRVTSIRFDQ